MSKSYIEKQSKIKEENLKYDFLPSMLEIIDKPENKMSTVIILLVLALIVTAVIWAAVSQTDISITAFGSVMPQGNLVPVQSIYGGEVTNVYVQDGGKVNAGDTLLTLDISAEEESLKLYEYELNLLEIQRSTYEKIKEYRSNEDKETDENGDIWVKYGVSKEDLGDNYLVAEAILREEELYGIKLKEYEQSVKISDHKDLAETQKEEFIAQRDLELIQNLNSLEVRIRDTGKSIEETKKGMEEKSIKAVKSGTVTNLVVNASGAIITAGSNVGYIIPDEEETIFRAYVKSSDIEGIGIGDEVSVKISALKDTDYSRIDGTVRKIGDAAISMEGVGSVYSVEIELDEMPEELRTGQEGTCDIIIGRRTIINYFLEPFVEGLNDSMHEK